MSRHTLVNEPNCEIVVGFDAPLRSFFGQRFDPSRPIEMDDLVDGWPTSRGLGVQPRIETASQAREAIGGLKDWLCAQGIHVNKAAVACVVLLREWRETPDRGEPAIMRFLREAESRH